MESKEVEDDKGNDASGTRMSGGIGEVVMLGRLLRYQIEASAR